MTMADNNERLLAACEAGDLTTVRSCLSASVDVNTKDGYGGSTPLHLALLYKHPQVVTELLYRQDIDLAVVDCDGYTALHLACAWDMSAIIPILGSRMPVHVLNIKDNEGITALMVAVEFGHLSCVQEMAKLEGVDWQTRNSRGDTLEDADRYVIGGIIIKTRPSTSLLEGVRINGGEAFGLAMRSSEERRSSRIYTIGIAFIVVWYNFVVWFSVILKIFINFFIRMNGPEIILAYLQKRKPLQQLCTEFITNNRDLFREEVEELPGTLKTMVKSQWSSLK